jgi:hypothetical protein
MKTFRVGEKVRLPWIFEIQWAPLHDLGPTTPEWYSSQRKVYEGPVEGIVEHIREQSMFVFDADPVRFCEQIVVRSIRTRQEYEIYPDEFDRVEIVP